MNSIEEIYACMIESLQKNKEEYEEVLIYAEQGCQITQSFLGHLKAFVLSHPFDNQEEEIRFFKEQKPLFLKEYLYYAELLQIESNRPVAGRQKDQDYLELNLQSIRLFFNRNRFLYNYYRMGKTALDGQFFVKETVQATFQADYCPDMDACFANVWSYNIARMLAYEALKRYLEQAQQESDPPLVSSGERPYKLSWLGGKGELIELCYALQSRGVFGNANVKQVVRYIEECFDISLGNFYRVFQEHRIRKKSRTLFLDSLIESLIRRMDDSDLNPRY